AGGAAALPGAEHGETAADGAGRAVHAHRPSFETISFELATPVSEEALEDLFYELPRAVYRVKGLVRTADGEAGWRLVNAVAGRFEIEPFDPADAPPRSALVFIGRDLDGDDLARRVAALAAPAVPGRTDS